MRRAERSENQPLHAVSATELLELQRTPILFGDWRARVERQIQRATPESDRAYRAGETKSKRVRSVQMHTV